MRNDLRKNKWLVTQAKRQGISVQELVQRILASEDIYDVASVKRNNFAKTLFKKQYGGTEDTLAKSENLGTIYTPINNVDLNRVIPNFGARKQGYITKNNCPNGIGCSEQATDVAAKILGVNRNELIPGDAAYRTQLFENYGMHKIWNPYGLKKVDAKSKDFIPFPKEKYSELRAGDLIGLDRGSGTIRYGPPKGMTEANSSNIEHYGVIIGKTEDGRPIIRHGSEAGKNRGFYYEEAIADDGTVSSLGAGRYKIATVYRHPGIENNTINRVKNVIIPNTQIAEDKANTSSSAEFFLKPITEMSQNSPLYSFSGKDSKNITKNNLINLFNNKEKDKELKYKLGLTQQELDNLKPVVYGIAGQESNFNNIHSLSRGLKEIIANIRPKSASKGLFQIKYNSLTPEERQVLGVNKPSDLNDDNIAYGAALLLLNNARTRMNKQVEEGTHPDLVNQDEYWRAAYGYNSPARARNTAEDWTKTHGYTRHSIKIPGTSLYLPRIDINIPQEQLLKEHNEDKNYYNLAMNKGSYPYKLMQKASELGVNYNQENPDELQMAYVIGKKNKNSKLIKKEKEGGPIVDPMGQWKHPYRETIVPTPTGQITMRGVPYPVLGQDETGHTQLMTPNGEYRFNGKYVHEIPLAQIGGYNMFAQQGGLHFLQPNDRKLPKGYVIPSRYPSSELAMSIGGEGNEPAFLIPSFKYGHPLTNPVEEFNRTGDHLGGPFKTWQDAENFEKIRHKYVEKGESLPTPLKWWNMQIGGRLVSTPNQSIVYDNISSPLALKERAQSTIQGKQQLADQKKPTLRSFEKRDKLEKIAAIISNPFTASRYATERNSIPDYFERGPRIGFDYATDYLPTSMALSVYNIPKDIKEGNYGKAVLSSLPILFPAFSLGKRLQNSPLLRLMKDNINYKNKYGYQRAGTLLGTVLAAEAAPIVSKIPGLRKPYKDLAYHFASKSNGNPGMSTLDILDILKKRGPKFPYKGSLKNGSLTVNRGRDLLKQYIYGNQPEFIPSKEIPRGLESYTNRYGKMGVYKLDSEAGDNAVERTEYFNDVLRKKQIKDDQLFSLTPNANPIIPYDDISGHMAWIENNNGSRDLITQDIWKFTPEDYVNKWGGASLVDHRFLDEDYYLRQKQAKLMDNAGKPFILMSRNPLANSSKFDPIEALNKKNIENNTNLENTYIKLNLDNFQKGGIVSNTPTIQNPYINYKKTFSLALKELYPKRWKSNTSKMVTENTAPSSSQMQGNPYRQMELGGGLFNSMFHLWDSWQDIDKSHNSKAVSQNTAPSINQMQKGGILDLFDEWDKDENPQSEDIQEVEPEENRRELVDEEESPSKKRRKETLLRLLELDDNSPSLMDFSKSMNNVKPQNTFASKPKEISNITESRPSNNLSTVPNNPGQYAFEYLQQKHGLPPYLAAGIVGNIEQESAFNPNALGDNRTSYGLIQWHGKRRDRLFNWANQNGRDPRQFETQLDYIVYENFNVLQDIAKSTKTSTTAANGFRDRVERPKNKDDRRARNAQKYFEIGGTYDLSPEEIADLRNLGYEFSIKY